jgi:apolipoprotein D and lipocalin family protein
LAPDYSYALVGVPGRKYLWILSRTPNLSQEAYDECVKRAAEQGFEVKVLVKTKHSQ